MFSCLLPTCVEMLPTRYFMLPRYDQMLPSENEFENENGEETHPPVNGQGLTGMDMIHADDIL